LRVVLTLGALVFVASPASARGEGERSYEGTVGASRIVLTLQDDANGEDAWGSYFYLSSRRDLDLQGERRGGVLTLDARATEDHLELRAQGDGFTGTLTTAAKRRFPVRLARVTTARDLPADLPPELSLHERLQLAGLTLAPEATERVDGKPIQWFRERKTGVRLFRLQGGYAARPMAAINGALTRNQWREVSRWLSCTDIGGEAGVDGGIEGKPWLGRDYVSYSWQASWSCAGAAHPDFGTAGYSFDARTGRELKLDEVLHFGSAPVPSEDSDPWYGYRGRVFAPAVVKLLQRHHPQEMAPVAPDGEECDYADPEVWDFPAWRLTPEGLWLGASFARVMRACDGPEWAVLPWSELSLKPQ
jgi:hypothetical protein